jgi:hypothetical protein
MWAVEKSGKVGIVAGINDDGSAEFHHVAADGTTSAVSSEPLGELVQARYREIPESRRKLSAKAFKALGYA